MSNLDLVKPAERPTGTPVIALAHNEANLVEPFLRHYRSLGPVHFVIVDDRSTDGTSEAFGSQPDVTLYRPAAGGQYSEHKFEWRQTLLSMHAPGRWALAPDLDELFVYWDMESKPFASYLAELDAEGAQGVLTVMVDMYADRPLQEHRFPDEAGADLIQAFPYFDGAVAAPFGYHFRYTRSSRAPTPPLTVNGGMRDRLFRLPRLRTNSFQLALINRVATLEGPVMPKGTRLFAHRLSRLVARGFFRDALDIHKVGLIRWTPGLRYRGAHRLGDPLRLSESISAFLHFKFTRGVDGLEYIAQRGQHFAGALFYREMLSSRDVLRMSPVFPGSRRFAGSRSLKGIIRDVPSPP